MKKFRRNWLAVSAKTVAVVDLEREHSGERRIELAGLIVDRGLLVVLARRDLGKIEVVGHDGLVQTRRRMPRVLEYELPAP
jgi:hypothetical protein